MVALWTAILLVGCSQDQVRVYEAPQSQPRGGMAAGPDISTPGMASTEHLHWELPDGWEETSSSGVRTATFRIAGEGDAMAEVAIMPFRGMGGNDLQFVNLWRSTLELPEVTEERLPDMVEEVQIGEDPAKLYDVMDEPGEGEAPPDTRIIVAMTLRSDTSWFFKLAGDASLVTTEKSAFIEFLKSITFHGADAHAGEGQVASSAPAAPPAANGANPMLPAWTVPEGWEEVAPTSMLLAKFVLSGSSGGQADVTVSMLGGDGGGLLANVNRWRGQVGLPPLNEASLGETVTEIDVAGSPANLVDMSGSSLDTSASTRLIVAVVPRGGRTWYFKLLGDATVASEQKDAFLQFLNSLQFPNA